MVRILLVLLLLPSSFLIAEVPVIKGFPSDAVKDMSFPEPIKLGSSIDNKEISDDWKYKFKQGNDKLAAQRSLQKTLVTTCLADIENKKTDSCYEAIHAAFVTDAYAEKVSSDIKNAKDEMLKIGLIPTPDIAEAEKNAIEAKDFAKLSAATIPFYAWSNGKQTIDLKTGIEASKEHFKDQVYEIKIKSNLLETVSASLEKAGDDKLLDSYLAVLDSDKDKKGMETFKKLNRRFIKTSDTGTGATAPNVPGAAATPANKPDSPGAKPDPAKHDLDKKDDYSSPMNLRQIINPTQRGGDAAADSLSVDPEAKARLHENLIRHNTGKDPLDKNKDKIVPTPVGSSAPAPATGGGGGGGSISAPSIGGGDFGRYNDYFGNRNNQKSSIPTIAGGTRSGTASFASTPFTGFGSGASKGGALWDNFGSSANKKAGAVDSKSGFGSPSSYSGGLGSAVTPSYGSGSLPANLSPEEEKRQRMEEMDELAKDNITRRGCEHNPCTTDVDIFKIVRIRHTEKPENIGNPWEWQDNESLTKTPRADTY